MANPFQGNFDDLEKALGEGLDVINKAAAEGKRKVVESQRTGQRLRIPAPREPVVGERPSPAIEKALVAETNAHRSLADAIRRHEEALHRLNALNRRQKVNPNDDALNAEIARLKQQRTRLDRDVKIKQQALANVSSDPDHAQTYADEQRKALRAEVRSVEVAEVDKTRAVQDGFERRRQFVERELQIAQSEKGKFFVQDPRSGKAYVPEGRERPSFFGTKARAQSELQSAAAEIARQGDFIQEKQLERLRERAARLGSPGVEAGMDQVAIANSTRRQLEVWEDLYARERGLQAATEAEKTRVTQQETAKRFQIGQRFQAEDRRPAQPITPDPNQYRSEIATRPQTRQQAQREDLGPRLRDAERRLSEAYESGLTNRHKAVRELRAEVKGLGQEYQGLQNAINDYERKRVEAEHAARPLTERQQEQLSKLRRAFGEPEAVRQGAGIGHALRVDYAETQKIAGVFPKHFDIERGGGVSASDAVQGWSRVNLALDEMVRQADAGAKKLFRVGDRFQADDRRPPRPVAPDPLKSAMDDFEKKLMRFARLVDIEAAAGTPQPSRREPLLTPLQRGSITRMMEAAFKQSFGQGWEPPPEHEIERQRRQSSRFQIRQDVAPDRYGALAGRVGPAADARAAEGVLDAERRVAALRGQSSQADNARILAQRLYQQELDDEVRARREGLRLQRESLERQRLAYNFANTEIRDRFPSTNDALAQRLAGGGGGRYGPPRPPAPPGPPDEPYPRWHVPAPERPGRRVFGHETPPRQQVEDYFRGRQDLGAEQQTKAIASYEDALRGAQTVERGHQAALRASAIEANRSITAHSALTGAYRKHGAATTEFLTALGRGQASVREIGWQALATAGKFGAWTAASVGVYGALTGVASVGHGAIESLSGVNELSRYINNLDTGRAQQQFRDLSQEFNLPIEDVTEAFAQMGRVSQNQTEAFERARAVLLATRVGNLEVADSTRFLSAIFQGFQIPAAGATTVIDQINSAQNNLNFSIRDGAAGIARAAGTWKAAGGTFSELLAIMATAQRSTGATGEVVGTAFRRSAEFIGRESNQAKLRNFGIDPTQGVDQVYKQAFSAVETGRVKGQDITRLATALSSPQLAAVIGPTLQNFELYRKALRETNAEAARGSAQRELAIQLDAVRERIAAVGRELEQLGSNLGQAGLLSSFALLLETLNLSLRAVNNLGEAFNLLPGPVKTAAAAWLQIYGAMRLMRRLNVGTFLTETAAANPGARRSQTLGVLGGLIDGRGGASRTAFKELQVGLQAESKYYEELVANYGRRQAAAAVEAEAAQRRLGELGAAGPASNHPRHVAAYNADLVKAQEASTRLDSERAAIAREEQIARQKLNDINERNLNITRTGSRNAAEGLRVAQSEAIALSNVPIAGRIPTLERPTTAGVQDFSRQSSQFSATPRGVIVPSRVAEAQTDVAKRARTAAAELQTAEVAAATSAGRLRRAGRGAVGALRGIGTAIAGFAPELAIIGGLLFAPSIIEHFKESARKRREQTERLKAIPLTAEGQETQLDRATPVAEERLRREEEARRRIQQANRAPYTPTGGITAQEQRLGQGLDRSEDEEAAIRIYQREQEAQRRRDDALRRQREADRRQKRTGLPQEPVPVPFQELEDIERALTPHLNGLARAQNSTARAAVLYRQYVAEIQQSRLGELSRASDADIIGNSTREELVKQARKLNPDTDKDASKAEAAGVIRDAAKARIESAMSNLRQRLQGFLSLGDINAFDPERSAAEIQTELERAVAEIDALGASRDRIGRAAIFYVQALEKAGHGRTDEQMQAIVKARDSFSQALEADAQQTIEAMSDATSEGARTNVFNRGLRRLRRPVNVIRRRVRSAAQEQAEAQTEANRTATAARDAQGRSREVNRGFRAFRLGRFAADLDVSSGARQAAQDALTAAGILAQKNRVLAGAKRALREGTKLTNRQLFALGENFLEQNELADAQSRLRTARLGNDNNVGVAREGRDNAQNKLRRAESLYRRGALSEIGITNARAEALEAQNALDSAIADGSAKAQDQLALMQSRHALAEAYLPDSDKSGAKGAKIVSDLGQQLAFAKANGLDEEVVNGLQQQIVEQNQQNAEDAKQRAEDLRQKQRDTISSLFDLRRSRTDNPVRQARLDYQEARRLRRVGSDDPNERRENQARVNETRRSRFEARHDREIENAELYNDIGRIGDQQLIAVYERAIRDTRTGANYRRELKQRLLRLKHQDDDGGEFELNVGNTRLPTKYETRRFVRGGRGGAGQTVVHNSPTFHISGTNPKEVANEVVSLLGYTLKTSTRASARAAGKR